MTGTDSVVGGGMPGRNCIRVLMVSMLLCPGKGLVLPNLTIDDTATHEQILPSTSPVIVTSSSKSQPPIPLKNTAPSTSNNLSTSDTSSSSTIFPSGGSPSLGECGFHAPEVP
ncbi:hypothetical protein TNCV_1495251 [Trichonephila clavipes]|nr:hypothetical protein TNCV_1495251 [Trichonephila clavipes]